MAYYNKATDSMIYTKAEWKKESKRLLMAPFAPGNLLLIGICLAAVYIIMVYVIQPRLGNTKGGLN